MSNSEEKTKKPVNKLLVVSIIIILLSIILSALLWKSTLDNAKKSFDSSFDSAYNQTKDSVYNEFYDNAFDYYERKNHVSNRVSLSIGNIKEENSLEVLNVSDSYMKITDPKTDAEDSKRWVEFNAIGVYTVDMNSSEFTIDNYHKLIVVRLKKPELNHVKLDNANINVYLYKYEKGLFKVNGTYDDGVNEALSDRAEALEILTAQLQNNDSYLTEAKKSAEVMVRTIIKGANSEYNLNDSNIIIEWK